MNAPRSDSSSDICANCGFSLSDRERDGSAQAIENREGIRGPDLRNEYLRRAIGVTFEFGVASRWNIPKTKNVSAANESVAGDGDNRNVVGANDLVGWMSGCSQDGPDNPMLIGDIKIVKDIELLPSPAREGLIPSKQVFYPGAWGLDTINSGLEFLPVIANRKHQVFVLCAPIDPDDLPNDMIKNAAKVVDCIAYYDREGVGDSFNEADLNDWLTSIAVVLDRESVRFAQYKRFELPFKVHNVNFCAFEL